MTAIRNKVLIRGVNLYVRQEEESEKPSRRICGRAILFNDRQELYRDEDTVVYETILPEAITQETLDNSDIKMTLYHNPERLLARSKNGKGTLTYRRSDEGIDFEFDAPDTPDGDTALELVRAGIVDGCSFWAYGPQSGAERTITTEGNMTVIDGRITNLTDIEDFTLTPCPVYEKTWVEAMKRDCKGADETIELAKSAARQKLWDEIENEINID